MDKRKRSEVEEYRGGEEEERSEEEEEMWTRGREVK